MLARPDLLDKDAPSCVEVFQLTMEDVPSCHIYMEARIFAPDSKRFVLHRSAHPHGADKHDSEHRYLLCDIEDSCSFSPLTEETGAIAPSVSPDGKCMYYVVDETTQTGGRITVKRVNLDGTGRTTIRVVDTALPGTDLRPCLRVYPLSTIRSDGKKLAVQVGLTGDKVDHPDFGLLIFDLETSGVELIHHGRSWCNMHPQYCRSTDPEEMHDLLIQQNHTGDHTDGTDKLHADIHVIRDDGTNFRTIPCGRDGSERCHGHQCWRGRSDWAIIGTDTSKPVGRRDLVETRGVLDCGHIGNRTPGGHRNILSREEGFPRTAHFGTDIAGEKLVTDADPYDEGGRVILMHLGTSAEDAASNLVPLAWPGTSNTHSVKNAHIHPFLSPDGSMAFFNSDESGILRAFMISGLSDV